LTSGRQTSGFDLAPVGSRVVPITTRSGRPWDEDELLVVLHALPEGRQDYSPRHRFVVELAVLLDRTPGAVSLHLANYVFLRDGAPHGKSHVGATIRAVFDEYYPRQEILAKRAEAVRARLVSRSLVPRVEGDPTGKRRAQQLVEDLEARVSEVGAPPEAVLAYRRKGSDYPGLLVAIIWVLSNPDAVRDWLGAAADVLRGAQTKSEGATTILAGESDSLPSKILERDIPGFHPEELSSADALKLARKIIDLGPLGAWRLTKKRLERLKSTRPVDLRSAIGQYFGIDASRLCTFCLGRLLTVLERKSKSPRRRGLSRTSG
jgi:hypothetical protein